MIGALLTLAHLGGTESAAVTPHHNLNDEIGAAEEAIDEINLDCRHDIEWWQTELDRLRARQQASVQSSQQRDGAL